MSTPYVGEIRCFGFQFAPVGWMFCNGQLLPIAQYDVLYAIIGTTYGGDGQTTFALPNLQGRIPMHWGNGPGGFNTVIGEVQGVTTVTLTVSQMPTHTHPIVVGDLPAGGVVDRVQSPSAAAYISASSPDQAYQSSPTLDAPFSPKALSTWGGSQPHDNMQPYLAVNFCIAFEGIFPSRN
jgi:microcystin-dependent protein